MLLGEHRADGRSGCAWLVTKRILIVPDFGCDEHVYRASDWRIQRTVVKAQRPRPLIIGDSGPCSRSRSAKQDVALAGLDEHAGQAHHFAGGDLRQPPANSGQRSRFATPRGYRC